MFYTRLRYSKDGAHNWTNWRQKELGVVGSFGKRTKFYQLGQAINFVFQESVTDDCRADLIAASLQLNGGGRWMPAPVVGGAYKDDVRPWASQDCVNRIPVPSEKTGARSEGILRDLPGSVTFATPSAGSHVRGMHNAEGKMLVVSGGSLYQVSTAGVSTNLGTIPGIGRVSMAHNQIANGNEVVIGNGLSGYVYNTVTNTLAQITDEAFPGFKSLDFIDGYIAGVEPQGNYWFISDLSGATLYNSLDRQEAETQPDKIVGLIVSHREVFVLGERTGQFFRNTGAGTGTFKNVNGVEMDVGAASTFAISRVDNSVCWVGSDGVGYRLNGNQPLRITTHAIEQAWSRTDMAQAYSFVHVDRGHSIWYVTMTDGQTWGFDVSTGEWHRKKSYGLDFWRMADLVNWNGGWYGGDYSNGKIYRLDWSVSNDDGQPLERSRTFGVLHDNQNPVAVNAIELVYNTGVA